MDNQLPCPKVLKGRARQLWFEIVRFMPITFMQIPAAQMWCYLTVEAEEKEGRMGAARIGHLKSLSKELGLFGRGKGMAFPEPDGPGGKYFNDDPAA